MSQTVSIFTPIRATIYSLRKTSKSTLDRRRYVSMYGYTQAKSLVYSKYGEPKDVLSLHTHSLSPPHSSLLTLRTLAAPLNPADINQIQGTYPTKPPFTSTLGTPEPSAVPGNEACFEVLAAGSGATSVKKGDWVIAKYTGLGTWRTHLQVEEDRVLRVDKDGLTPAQAGTVGVNPVTAWRMLKDFVLMDPDKGDWFIQNGANSGVGRAAIQLGKRWGYKNIAVVRDRPGQEGEELKRELQELGATEVVSETEVLARDFPDKVKQWTNGGREHVRLGLNCVGGKPATALAKVLAPGAHLVTYGAMSKQPMQIPAGMLIFKNLVFDGFWVSKWSDANPVEKEKTVGELLEMMRRGEFRDVPVVEVPWGWETKGVELVEAVQGTLEGFRKGKGVFVFGDDT
ncbi:mitochondrial 2-enoyl thioester reductase [Ptychographa xylographoides]|nr:mitochondrial 2-enoyl thioester reductase [Ptychographa xylographoides]